MRADRPDVLWHAGACPASFNAVISRNTLPSGDTIVTYGISAPLSSIADDAIDSGSGAVAAPDAQRDAQALAQAEATAQQRTETNTDTASLAIAGATAFFVVAAAVVVRRRQRSGAAAGKNNTNDGPLLEPAPAVSNTGDGPLLVKVGAWGRHSLYRRKGERASYRRRTRLTRRAPHSQCSHPT